MHDENYQTAKNLLKNIRNSGDTVLMPTLIYGEIINTVYRLGYRNPELAQQQIINFQKLEFIHADENFWTKKLAKVSAQTKLKTSDAAIVLYAIEFKVDDLITLDKKLLKAYQSINKYL